MQQLERIFNEPYSKFTYTKLESQAINEWASMGVFPPTSKAVPSKIEKTTNLLQKYKDVKMFKKFEKSLTAVEQDTQDFDLLFDWVDHLNESELVDFHRL